MSSLRTTVLFLAVGFFATAAEAQQAQWLNGGFGFEPGLACVTWNPETTVTSFAGYWGTDTASFPQTGDVSYVHAVGAVVGNPCSGGDVIDFNFQMPAGASPAVSAQNPVSCIATRLSDGMTTTTDSNIHCLQSPVAGTHGGLDFGYAVVPSGWMFEIRVPVRFERQLLGMAGSAADNLKVGVVTVDGYTLVEAWVTAPYRALVNYPSPSASFLSGVGTNAYRVTANVYNYYKAGTVEFESGSSSGIYDDGVIFSYALPDTSTSYQVYSDLEFGAYTSDVYWRARYVTASGTFFGAEQHFVANHASPAVYGLTVSKAGGGSGTVSSNPQGLDCGATCSQSYTAGTQVTLTAAPDPGSTFTGWSGACSGTGTCSVSMTTARAVTATFGVAAVPTIGSLDVTVDGLPGGTVASIAVTGPGGYSHTFNLLAGTGQSLSDVAPGLYVAVAANVISAPNTYVARPSTMTVAVPAGGKGLIAASYELGRLLDVSKSGSGSGSVTSSPGGLSCGAVCATYFVDGEQVTLSASPDAGSVFAGWSIGCTGTGACVVTMSAAASVVATFDPAPAGTLTLSVSRAGTGVGTVTSSPTGIDCGSVCNFNFASGTEVTLTATPTTGSDFSGWTGGCSGTGTCVVTLNAATSVVAVFDLPGTTAPVLTAGAAANPPASATRTKGDLRVPMLGFDLGGASAGDLQSLTLTAAGSGNDATDLTAVELFVDTNGNGQADAGETAIASGTFAADNGTLTLTPSPAFALPAGTTHLLVVASIASSLGAGVTGWLPRVLPRPTPWWPLVPLMAALALVGVRRRPGRPLWVAAGLALAMAACGSDSSSGNYPIVTARTYALTLTAVSAQSGAQAATVSGLPLVGATISVEP